MAYELLDANKENRPLDHAHVRRIARQIMNGRWLYNGDTIKVCDTGDVLDGQHRLWACVEAKMPIETVLVRGIKKEAFTTIDTIRKPRSIGDVVALKRGEPAYRTPIAHALAWLYRFQQDIIPESRLAKNRIENSIIDEMLDSHPKIVDAVAVAVKLRKIVNPSLLAFFYYILNNRDEALAERLMNALSNPGGLGQYDPFFVLRLTLLDRARRDHVSTIAIMIKATNAAHEGREVRQLVWRNQGEKGEAFPELLARHRQYVAGRRPKNGAGTNDLKYQPDLPPQSRGVRIMTAKLAGDPAPERSALAAKRRKIHADQKQPFDELRPGKCL